MIRPLAVAAGLLLAACAPAARPPALPAPETLPPGSPLRSRSLPEADAWLRHHLIGGEHDSALRLLETAPRDPLLRRLQEGVVRHAAGEFRRSNEAFEWAEREADRRYTRSLSRAAASLVVNDRVMAYTPTAAELAMIPYYRMLNYLALRDLDGAGVEARKADALLARLEEGRGGCREVGMVHYLSGLVHGALGERSDALVSLRHAERAFRACSAGSVDALLGPDLHRAARSLGLGETADSVARRYGLATRPAAGDAGELVVVVEHGFVAHRAAQALHVPIYPEDLEEGESGAGTVAGRLAHDLLQRAAYGAAWNDHPLVQLGDAMEGAYILRLAWPVHRVEACRPAAVRVVVDDSVVAVGAAGDLSAAAQRELNADRPAMLARLVGRGVAKYLVSREVEKKAEKQGGEFAAFVAGRLSNLAGNVLEQADTRSWTLLPDRVSVARARLSPGEHRVRLEALSERGEVVAERDLGVVRVEAGQLLTLSQRLWGPEQGEAIPWAVPAPGPAVAADGAATSPL